MGFSKIDSRLVNDKQLRAELIERADHSKLQIEVWLKNINSSDQFVVTLSAKTAIEVLQEVTQNHTLDEFDSTSSSALGRQQLPQYDEMLVTQSKHISVYPAAEYDTQTCTLCGDVYKPPDDWFYEIQPQKTTENGYIQPRYSLTECRFHRDCLIGVLHCCEVLIEQNQERVFAHFV